LPSFFSAASSPAVRQRLQIVIAVFAWFMATGSQWDLAQVVAWGRMFAGYAQEMPLAAAVQKTFSGKKCRLCEVVQHGKKQQEESAEHSPLAKAAGKMFDLCLLSTSTAVYTPSDRGAEYFGTDLAFNGRGRATPPSPPPRA
jgi:hypothetical protein